jgi:hypothetical protein
MIQDFMYVLKLLEETLEPSLSDVTQKKCVDVRRLKKSITFTSKIAYPCSTLINPFILSDL